MKLAINGGLPIRTELFPDQNTMDVEEMNVLMKVVKNGRPSGYRANTGPHFKGGPEIQALEKEWAIRFEAEKDSCIAVNSATSGLFTACAAIGLKPGDEVIVTPYSMTCSATIPLWFGARPVFADVEKDYFCLDPEDVYNKITAKTRAVIVVDLFGQPANYIDIKKVIKNAEMAYGNKIYLITDTAQAPGATYNGQYTGTIGDIGVFSLNFGKHMTCGEGGVIIAEDKELNYRCRLTMNHGESVINDVLNGYSFPIEEKERHPVSIIGLNLRMTEFQAAVARIQLLNLGKNIQVRRDNVKYLHYLLKDIPAITPALIRENSTHVYYVDAYLWGQEKAEGLHRDKYIEAVKAELTPRKGRDGEGVQIGSGYIKPIDRMPWNEKNIDVYNSIDENRVVDDLYEDKLFLSLLHAPNSGLADMHDVAMAFHKVWENRGDLK